MKVPFERGWATSKVDPRAIAMWWVCTTQGRYLCDLLGDERLAQQWQEITLNQLRQLPFPND